MGVVDAMASEPSRASSRTLLLLNPKSSSSSPDLVRRSIDEQLAGCDVEVHEMAEGDDLRRIVAEAVDRGVALVVAAGGDGTVSTVADVLAGTDVQLAIFPMGTANVFAHELGIPFTVEEACRLVAGRLQGGPHAVARIDAMRIGGHHYFTQAGVGIDSLMIRDTDDASKRRFGRAAYLWTALTRILGFQPRRFTIAIDGRDLSVRATEVVVANVGSMGQPSFRWGPGIRPDDGRLDVCIVRARSMTHYLHLFWVVLRARHRQSPHVRYEASKHSISIASKPPLPVQADGEIIGETPVRIEVVPATLQVIVPEDSATPAGPISAAGAQPSPR